eukprot:jgi/Chrzof1/4122/UNPLg00787.t1
MPAVLRRASGSGNVDISRTSSGSNGSPKIGAWPEGHTREPNLREVAARSNHHEDAIMQHYMVKIASNRKLKTDVIGPDVRVDVVEGPAIPPRAYVRSRHWSRGLFVCFMLGTSTYLMYALITRILEAKAWYATPMLVVLPIGMLYFSYAAATMVNGLWNLLGSNKRLDKNAQHYSAIKTPIPKGSKLPQIVVQMPVYKESLDEVISKTFFNVSKAVQHYISKGGVAKYVICDDGLQVISPDEAVDRLKFYKDNNIAFVARPPGNRRGIFKK